MSARGTGEVCGAVIGRCATWSSKSSSATAARVGRRATGGSRSVSSSGAARRLALAGPAAGRFWAARVIGRSPAGSPVTRRRRQSTLPLGWLSPGRALPSSSADRPRRGLIDVSSPCSYAYPGPRNRRPCHACGVWSERAWARGRVAPPGRPTRPRPPEPGTAIGHRPNRRSAKRGSHRCVPRWRSPAANPRNRPLAIPHPRC